MPLYEYACMNCDRRVEEYRRLSEIDLPAPTCDCGSAMKIVPARFGIAFVTRGGNLYRMTPAAGKVTKGNRKPKTVSRGHGLGGRRKPPTIERVGKSTFSVEAKK